MTIEWAMAGQELNVLPMVALEAMDDQEKGKSDDFVFLASASDAKDFSCSELNGLASSLNAIKENESKELDFNVELNRNRKSDLSVDAFKHFSLDEDSSNKKDYVFGATEIIESKDTGACVDEKLKSISNASAFTSDHLLNLQSVTISRRSSCNSESSAKSNEEQNNKNSASTPSLENVGIDYYRVPSVRSNRGNSLDQNISQPESPMECAGNSQIRMDLLSECGGGATATTPPGILESDGDVDMTDTHKLEKRLDIDSQETLTENCSAEENVKTSIQSEYKSNISSDVDSGKSHCFMLDNINGSSNVLSELSESSNINESSSNVLSHSTESSNILSQSDSSNAAFPTDACSNLNNADLMSNQLFPSESDDTNADVSAPNSSGGEGSVSVGTGANPEDDLFSFETIQCIFCSAQVIDQEPKLLPCLHSACNKCLSHEASQAVGSREDDIVEMDPLIQCPICKKGFSQDAIIDNMFINELSSGERERAVADETFTCTSCTDDATASGLCTDCSEWLCNACIQAHQRVKVTKDHTIKSKSEIGTTAAKAQTNRSMFCTQHRKEHLNLYCLTCDQLTCRDCQLKGHRDHKYKFSEEMASLTREKLRHFLVDIRKKRCYIENAKDLVKERREQIRNKEEGVTTDISRLVDTFTDIIRQRGSTLCELLKEVCSAKQEQLDKKNEVLLHLGTQADSCIRVVDTVLNSSSDMALLYSKKILMDQVQKVDKDSPDRSLFDRFKTKLNHGDDISLRISSESRGLGKALKDVGYLLVDNRIYPPGNTEGGTGSNSTPPCGTPKLRSSQPSPLAPSFSPTLPRPESLPGMSNQSSSAAAPVQPTPPPSAGLPSAGQPSHHSAPPPSGGGHGIHPQPPTLTPMHSHVQQQQQQLMQNAPMPQKFHSFGPSPPGAQNPPGLVRIQPKPGMNANHIGQFLRHPGQPMMPGQPTGNMQPGRLNDVSSSVSSSTHPLTDSSHLRGLLGSGGSYKLNSYTHMVRMQQQQRLLEQQQHQSRRALNMGHMNQPLPAGSIPIANQMGGISIQQSTQPIIVNLHCLV